jgi:hypothetical protein
MNERFAIVTSDLALYSMTATVFCPGTYGELRRYQEDVWFIRFTSAKDSGAESKTNITPQLSRLFRGMDGLRMP